jgi:hypothetical protein
VNPLDKTYGLGMEKPKPVKKAPTKKVASKK